MATRKCPNGHQYDSNIYGDNCPFCPSGHTRVNNSNESSDSDKTKTSAGGSETDQYKPTTPIGGSGGGGGRTVIRVAKGKENSSNGNRRLAGILVSYSANPAGDVYKIYGGVTIIGRDAGCDLSFPNDPNMSGRHLLIQYIDDKGVFRAGDQGSSNGTYINGEVFVYGEVIDIKTNDVIVLGSTKFIFLAIPKF